MIELGQYNEVVAVFGEKGTGKSTWLKRFAREFLRRTGGFVIGHSPKGQIGADKDVIFADSIKELDANLQRYPSRLHFVTVGRPEDVIEYGRAMSRRLRERAVKHGPGRTGFAKLFGRKFHPNRPAPPGTPCPPVLILIDEGIEMQEAPTREEATQLQTFLTAARHEHVGFVFSIQAPSKRAWMITEQARVVVCFRYMHEWGFNSIRAGGVPMHVIERVKALPRFEYLYFDKDVIPARYEFRRLPAPSSKS